jgi:hypothetical protein
LARRASKKLKRKDRTSQKKTKGVFIFAIGFFFFLAIGLYSFLYLKKKIFEETPLQRLSSSHNLKPDFHERGGPPK